MKRRPPLESDFMEGFAKWMGSEEGLQSIEASEWVFDAFDGASVDPSEKRIIWPDGQRLSIEQSVERIQEKSGLDKHAILSHIIGWLQMEYIPEGLDDKQMQMFESQINDWVEEYEKILIQSSSD